MPLDAKTVAKGANADETPEQRAKREAIIANSPRPQPFRLRAELVKSGRTNQVVAETDNMKLNLKVYSSGGENGLHNHTDEDHFHLVLQGSARFYGPRGEELDCGPYEGVMLPAGCFYRFNATSKEPLVLLRVGASNGVTDEVGRYTVYGEPIPSDSKENGRGAAIVGTGEFFGAAEKK
jgi:mannose-6-phosphate isomerase-like protein (cupin superfamily)